MASSSNYEPVRYLSSYSESLGGVTLPLSDEVGNSLFNNPAALARNTKFKAEVLNFDLDTNSSFLNTASTSTLKGLSGLESTLNSHTNQTYASGYGNLTAVSWGGLGVGLLVQDRTRAYSDGTNIYYQTQHQMIPAVGYGLGLARGVVRLGASAQYVNEVSGTNKISSTGATPDYDSGVGSGKGLSTTFSGSIVFPFTYLPTINVAARNIGALHFSGNSIYPSATSANGEPSDQKMSLDMALSFMVRVSGEMKTQWYFEYDDASSAYSMPFLERVKAGLDFQLNRMVGIRGGLNGTQFSAGIGYRGEDTELNLAYYSERSPFTAVSTWDTRYALQYKFYLQDKNSRDRKGEEKGPK